MRLTRKASRDMLGYVLLDNSQLLYKVLSSGRSLCQGDGRLDKNNSRQVIYLSKLPAICYAYCNPTSLWDASPDLGMESTQRLVRDIMRAHR